MKFSLLIFFASLLTVFQVQAADSAVVCSTQSETVCAYLTTSEELNSKDEGKFLINLVLPEDAAIQGFKADLWMQMGPHGHGSAPLKISALGTVNQFAVTNAWFVMKGKWLVRIDFALEGEQHHIEIPVEIAR